MKKEDELQEIEVVETEEVVKPKPKTSLLKVVNCSRLNVREKPNKSSKVIKIIDKDSVLESKKVFGEWVLIKADKIEGFVMKTFTEKV